MIPVAHCTLVPATELPFPSRFGGRATLVCLLGDAQAPPEAPLRYSLKTDDRIAVEWTMLETRTRAPDKSLAVEGHGQPNETRISCSLWRPQARKIPSPSSGRHGLTASCAG
jgi:hypothetical protein